MPSRLKQLQDKKASLVRDARSILDAVQVDDRDITPEEKAKLDGYHASISRVDGMLSDEQALQEVERSMAPSIEQPEAPTAGILGQAIVVPKVGKIGKVEPAFIKDPMKGFASPRDFIMAVMGHPMGIPAAESSDERLRFLATAGSDEQGAYSDPYGGFLVPKGMSPGILQITPEDDPIGARTRKVPMTAPQVSFNARVDKTHTSSVSGGLTVTRRVETGTQSASRMSFEQVVLNATSLFGLAYATEEILTDSPVSFAAILEAGFSDQFTSHLIDERLNGTGVGEFMGVLKSPCLISVTKETLQDAASIVYENVVNMRSRCWRYSQAVWLYNHDCLPQLQTMVQVIGTSGVPVWQTSARENEPDMLLGRPAFPTEYCKTLGTAGDVILGVWSEYLEGTYENLQSAESVHVRFINHERTFKFWLRNAGAPWWNTYLTPKNSTATLSPFVVIETRA